MGKRLDALLGRTFRFSKLKTNLKLTVSRITILKNQKKTRCSHARNDVTGLLKQGQQDSALLRVEHVIKEQNMLDVFVMIEGYCNLLKERGVLLKKQKSCPEELKEAISSLVFAASRCGELPELQEIRSIFTVKFGKEFTAATIELPNSCGVNAKMIQKMSAGQSSLEMRLKVLKEIATENGFSLNLQVSSETNKELQINQNQNQPNPKISSENPIEPVYAYHSDNLVELEQNKKFSGRSKAKEEFTDVETAAQVAFESAAYAAEAARAAVELSRAESQDRGSDGGHSSRNRGDGSSKSRFHETPEAKKSNFEKNHLSKNSSSESDTEELVIGKREKRETELERTVSVSSSDSSQIESNESDWKISRGSYENPLDFEYNEVGIDQNHSGMDILSGRRSRTLKNRGRTEFGYEKNRVFESEAHKVHYTEKPEDDDEVLDSPRKSGFASVRTRRGAK